MDTPSEQNRAQDVKRAPVIEAIIEIVFPAPEERLNMEWLDKLAEEYKPEFPVSKKLYRPTNDAHEIQNSQEPLLTGIELRSPEGKESFQSIAFEANKLQVSHFGLTGTYCGGDKLTSLFMTAMASYLQYINHSQAERLGMRYINKIISPPEEIAKKFTVVPMVPPMDEELLVNEIFYNASIADRNLENKANINYLFSPEEQNKKNGGIGVYIDIDAYQEQLRAIEVEMLKNKIQSIRKFKNAIFEGSFTPYGFKEFTDVS